MPLAVVGPRGVHARRVLVVVVLAARTRVPAAASRASIGRLMPLLSPRIRPLLALMQGLFLVITLSVLVANILADVAHAALDPRTRATEA